MRWASVCRILAAELTPAAVSAWLRPLTPVALAAAPDRGGLLLVLACNTAFHRDHVLRRYRAAIERAAGAACEVVVRPAQPESGTQVAPQPPGSAPAPASPRPALALAPAPAPSAPAPATPVGGAPPSASRLPNRSPLTPGKCVAPSERPFSALSLPLSHERHAT